MSRAKLRSRLLEWALGQDPTALVEELRRTLAAVQTTRTEQWSLGDRLARLERIAIVAVDPFEGEELRRHVDPYLDTAGLVLCTAADAHVAQIRPLERITVG